MRLHNYEMLGREVQRRCRGKTYRSESRRRRRRSVSDSKMKLSPSDVICMPACLSVCLTVCLSVCLSFSFSRLALLLREWDRIKFPENEVSHKILLPLESIFFFFFFHLAVDLSANKMIVSISSRATFNFRDFQQYIIFRARS